MQPLYALVEADQPEGAYPELLSGYPYKSGKRIFSTLQAAKATRTRLEAGEYARVPTKKLKIVRYVAEGFVDESDSDNDKRSASVR